MVAENYRYDSGLLKIKELIENGALGRVYSADWNVYLFMGADSRYRHIKWRVEHKYPGGFVMDAGIHNIAGLRMLFGELDIRAAQSLCIEPGLGRVDTLMMMFETDSGVKGTFNDYFRSNGYYENRLVVFGTDGTIVFNRDRSGETVVVQGREIPRREFKFEHSESYKNEFEDFYNAVVKDKRPKSSFEEGAKDFETMLGALKLAGAD
jgi:predicted dehydrogenase